ncbi:VOC family protein [uncultured Formosa sp.]|uniref:VOC family protein n=1 Tax=uncultured Formosa sp. TaxID=255435 RepID=UPI002637DF12|nr:VOC family protein [uncultured Formosa sp.]
MQSEIVPYLWFNQNAKAAATYYSTVFNNSEILSEQNNLVHFKIDGKRFIGCNGGPKHTINSAVSFFVYCGSNTEIERLYTVLSTGGSVIMPLGTYPWCKKYAWVKDQFGVSWQLDIDAINATQNIVPSLLFTENNFTKLKEASAFYRSLFPKSISLMESPYGNTTPNVPEDTLAFTQFKLNTNIFNIISSNLEYNFSLNKGISFVIYCDTQAEIDHLWNAFTTHGGKAQQSGWITDHYGVSWQIIPTVLNQLLADSKRAPKITEALLKMTNIDITTLQEV